MADTRGIGASSSRGKKFKAAKTDGVGDSILFVYTEEYLFVLDLKGKPRGDSVKDPPDPVLLGMVDLVEDGFPEGMGVLRVESKVFMFGGKLNALSTRRRSTNCSLEDMVKDVYKLDTCNWSLVPTDEVEPPISPKSDPVVNNMGDKTFVHNGSPHDNPCPIFEVYDSSTKSWNKLPDIPCAVKRKCLGNKDLVHLPGIVSGSLGLGHMIYFCFYLRGSNGNSNIFSFNTLTRDWKDVSNWKMRSYFDYASVGRSVPVLNLGRGYSVVFSFRYRYWPDGDDDDLKIPTKHVFEAYLLDEFGDPLLYQDLGNGELFKEEYFSDILYLQGHSFMDMGSGRMCLVFIASTLSGGYIISISRFQVTKLSAADGPFPSSPEEVRFVQVGSVIHQFCTLPVLGDPCIILRDAFFL